MILLQIRDVSISNFKNYNGLSTVNLETNSDENIVLIGGKNGFGKSTLCEAIRLCLFGKKLFGSPLSKNEYNEYLKSVTNDQNKNSDSQSFINLNIQMDESFGNYEINVQRKWTYKNGEVNGDELIITRNGREFEYIPEDYWEDYLESILPTYLSKFFIFDGEKVEEFAIDPEFQKWVKESLKDVVGLKIYETLDSDLHTLSTKIKRRNIQEEKLRKKIQEKITKINDKKDDITSLKSEIDSIEKKIEELKENKVEIEEELDRISGKVSKHIKKKNEQLDKLKTKKEQIYHHISDQSSSFLPFIISWDIADNLFDQLEIEKEMKEKRDVKDFIKKVNGKFTAELETQIKNDKNLKDDHKDTIKKHVKNTFEKILEEEKEEHKIIHDLTKSEMQKIQSFVKMCKRNINNGYKEKVSELKDIENNISDLKKELKRSSEGKQVTEYIEKISEIENRKGTLIQQKDHVLDKIENLENEINKIQKQKKKLENDIICSEIDSRKVELISKIKNVLNEVEKNVIVSRLDNLENCISNMYHKLANKDDMVEEISIDPESLSIELYDSNKNKLNKENLSTGEKEIFAISLLYGLIKISDYNFPVIIDAPLTSLDEEHADNILSKFVPNLSDQIIFLSVDREIDKEKYKLISDKIAKEYVLKKDGPDKIKEGYFFEQ